MISVATLDTGEQDRIHYGAIRLRVNGNGLIRPTFTSFDNVDSYTCVPLTMVANTAIEPTRLSNFITQRAFLKIETTAIDEIFKINRIIVFAKPIFTSFPG